MKTLLVACCLLAVTALLACGTTLGQAITPTGVTVSSSDAGLTVCTTIPADLRPADGGVQ